MVKINFVCFSGAAVSFHGDHDESIEEENE
jgi:hypothetical protein